MSGRLLALLAAVLLSLGVGACSGGDDDGGGDPEPAEVPAGAVAKVGDAEVSEKALNRQVRALARAQRRGGAGSSGGAAAQRRKQLEAQALATLLMRRALEQEAKDRGIKVRRAEVRKRWRAVSRSQFKTKRALRRFLGGQTVRELVEQLRLQTLTERIHAQVRKQAGGGKEGDKAVREFQKDFQKRWQERTTCREGYEVAGCVSRD